MGLNYESLPVIETHINGKPVRLLVDTGAERTVLFKDIAKNVGLKNISIGSVESVFIQGSNNRTNKANYTILESLNIGELGVKNNIAYILKRPFGMDFIDGSLGWDIISRIKLEIDAENKRITIYPSDKRRDIDPNFFWFFMPVLKLNDNKYGEIQFAFDSGSSQSFFNELGIEKLHLNTVENGKKLLMGIGGIQLVPSTVIKNLELKIDDTAVVLKNHKNIKCNILGYNFQDGIIGMDIIKHGVLTLDYPSGRFSFVPSLYSESNIELSVSDNKSVHKNERG